MKRFLFSLIIILFVALIQNCTGQVKGITSTKDSSKQVVADEKTRAISQLSDYFIFWEVFRKAIIENDTVKLKELTNFPLKAHGYQDSDPIIEVSKDDFLKVFNKCLKEQTVVDKIDGSILEHIKRLSNLRLSNELVTEEAYLSWQRVGNMEFEKLNNKWMLTAIYIDTNKK
jgi:hypothetical protein